MRTFFEGWRRKMGVVTLMLACVLTVGSVRSLSRVDHVVFPSRGVTFGLMSIGGCLNFYVLTKPEKSTASTLYSSYVLKYFTSDGRPLDITPWLGDGPDRRWKLGFHCGRRRSLTNMEFDLMVPYWFVVLLLTLFSAQLFLSQPPTSTKSSVSRSS